MRHLHLWTLVVTIFTATVRAEPQPDNQIEQRTPFNGDWEIVRVEVGGKTLDDLAGQELTFDKNRLHGLGTDAKGFIVKLDPMKSPKQIDLIRERDSLRWLGVYELKDDQLRLCLAMVKVGGKDPQRRPTDFDKNKVQMLITCRRPGD